MLRRAAGLWAKFGVFQRYALQDKESTGLRPHIAKGSLGWAWGGTATGPDQNVNGIFTCRSTKYINIIGDSLLKTRALHISVVARGDTGSQVKVQCQYTAAGLCRPAAARSVRALVYSKRRAAASDGSRELVSVTIYRFFLCVFGNYIGRGHLQE